MKFAKYILAIGIVGLAMTSCEDWLDENPKYTLDNSVIFENQEYAKQEETEINRRKAALEQELKNDQGHYEELRLQLQRERQRITRYLLPNRYTLDGDVQIYPLAVEIVLPRKGAEK